MMTDTIRLSTVIPASAERIYRAWLSAREHSAFTGGKATVIGKVGGRFTAWDGYIEGTNLELKPQRRIVQAWRTSEFPRSSPDSRLEVVLDPASGGTRITLVHTSIPPGQGDKYRAGWEKHYLTPMKRYFAREVAHPSLGHAPQRPQLAGLAKTSAPAAASSAPIKKRAAATSKRRAAVGKDDAPKGPKPRRLARKK